MPFLSRKRKRKVNGDNDVSTMSSSTVNSANSSDIELLRTDENNSRLSNSNFLDNSLNQNFNKSVTQNQNSQRMEQIVDNEPMEPMDTQIIEEFSNQWADDFSISMSEPTNTQLERNVGEQRLEEINRSKQNVAECGTLESITLINFMCHKHFHLDFGPRINFIVGRNGSGKSAILTAIVLGFGGRASTTSRGKGIASFIKCGETQSKVIIKICNTDHRSNGKEGFNFEDFGPSIIIERTINSSGSSTYKIKSSTGKVIADKKECLEQIIRYFNIQIDNPICVLNQEVSRNFLNTKNSKDKYTFFMKATLLEDMKNDYAASETDRSIASKSIEEKQQIIPETKKDIKRLEQKVKMFNDLENHKERFEHLNGEAIWALVYEQKRKLNALKEQMNKLEEKLENDRLKVDSEKESINKLESEKNNFKTRLENLVKDVENTRQTYEGLKDNCSKIKDEIREKDKEKRSVEIEIITNRRDIQSLERKITELNQQFSDESHNNRKTQIHKLKEQIQKLSEEENEILLKYNEINQTNNELGEEKVKLSQEFNQLKASISAKEREIDRLNQSRKERLQRFGPKYPELVKKIEEMHRRGEFRKKPLGPIGNHIQLRDYSCALAVEICLKRNLYAFCCDNMNDQKKLRNIIDHIFGNERKPPIITREFCDLHDVSQQRVRCDQYKSFFDLMIIKEAAITNALIDQLRIEQILYIPDYKSAEQLMIDKETAPHNCYQSFTRDGCVMIPSTDRQDYRSFANNSNKRNANILMKNVEQILTANKEELDSLKKQIPDLEKNIKQNRNALDLNRRDLTDLDSKKKKNRSEVITKDTKLKELESIGDSPPVEVSTLEEELQTYGAKMAELEEKLKSVKDEKETLNQSYIEADEQMMTKRSEYESLMTERHPLKENMEKIDTDLKNHGLVLTKYEKLFNETKKSIEEQNRLLAAKEEEYENDESKAMESTGQPIETKRTSKTVFNEIKQLEKFLDEQENSIGNKDEIYSNYKMVCQHFKRVNSEINLLEQHLSRLKCSLELRRKGYLELRNFYSIMTKFFFMDILKHKKFSGSLDIYHKEMEVNGEIKKAKTLEIRVNPKSDEQNNSQSINGTMGGIYSDTRSLSGGERSYSTVAFILALWESAQSPFKILDEVDVFMDLVTRQFSLDAMIEFASQKSGKQYIFLSPLKIQKLTSPELIKIFQMPEPLRSQTDT